MQQWGYMDSNRSLPGVNLREFTVDEYNKALLSAMNQQSTAVQKNLLSMIEGLMAVAPKTELGVTRVAAAIALLGAQIALHHEFESVMNRLPMAESIELADQMLNRVDEVLDEYVRLQEVTTVEVPAAVVWTMAERMEEHRKQAELDSMATAYAKAEVYAEENDGIVAPILPGAIHVHLKQQDDLPGLTTAPKLVS